MLRLSLNKSLLKRFIMSSSSSFSKRTRKVAETRVQEIATDNGEYLEASMVKDIEIQESKVKKQKRLPVLTEKALSSLRPYSAQRPSSKFLGAHVSAAGGLYKSFLHAQEIGANAFALFLKSRKWTNNDLTEEDVQLFQDALKLSGISAAHILPHGQYIINLGNPDPEKRQKGYTYFVDDLKRCDRLGLQLYNLHPGSSVGACTKQEAIAFIADCLNRALAETVSVKVVLEVMAGQREKDTIVGGRFEEIRAIMDLVEDKKRVGVCLDTCHIFAAGYDIRTPEKFNQVLEEFDRIIGLKNLLAVHLNDSKGELGCCADRHEFLGKGKIGLDAFRFIMRDDRFNDMPLVLETPIQNDDFSIWVKEVALLRSFEEDKD